MSLYEFRTPKSLFVVFSLSEFRTSKLLFVVFTLFEIRNSNSVLVVLEVVHFEEKAFMNPITFNELNDVFNDINPNNALNAPNDGS